MTAYLVQEWPDMPGDDEGGDAIIICSTWRTGDWERHKSHFEAWMWLEGNVMPGDTVTILTPNHGERSNDYVAIR